MIHISKLGERLTFCKDVHYTDDSCSFRISGHAVKSVWTDVFTTPVEVTTGRPSFDQTRGLKIIHRQSIASFFSKIFPNPLEANLDPESRFHSSASFSKVASTSVSIGQEGKTSLKISFARTVRIPEDGKKYDLPPNLGCFPLFDTRPFRQRLPPSVAAQGGLFMPMYRT